MKNSYAFIVGINHYLEPGNDLAGCVQDASDWHELLIGAGMPPENIGMRLDDQATKSMILGGLGALMRRKTPKHRVVVVLDCCHASTGTRLYGGPSYCRVKSIPYPGPSGEALPLRRFGIRQDSLSRAIASPRQKHVLLAACRANQTAADASFHGRPNGAFTWALMTAIHELGTNADAHDLIIRAKYLLRVGDYAQIPTLEGPEMQREMPLFTDNTLLFIYSGHGSQVPCVEGDEGDRLDEILVPFDHSWDCPLKDDDLRAILKG